VFGPTPEEEGGEGEEFKKMGRKKKKKVCRHLLLFPHQRVGGDRKRATGRSKREAAGNGDG